MYLDRLFKLMAEKQASDLFISCGAPINIKINGIVSPISTQPMDVEAVRRIAYELMTKDQAREFENEMEMNLSYLDRAVGNFRINIFRQRGTISLVIRYVRSSVPPSLFLNSTVTVVAAFSGPFQPWVKTSLRPGTISR